MVLNNKEIETKLAQLEGWKRVDAKNIERTFTFSDYLSSISFVQQIAEHAEDVAHHPTIVIEYKHVIVRLTTHDEGGITEKDIHSAAVYNDLFQS